jgi:hypothetical protein
MKAMKAMMSVLIVMIMAFALVSISEAGWCPFCSNANSGVASGNVNAKDTDNPGHFSAVTPYPCGVESPAYLDYTDAHAVPCDRERGPSKSERAPEPMGSPSF